MNLLEELAEAALNRDALRVRTLTQDLLRSPVSLSEQRLPESARPEVVVVAAGLVELIAMRGQVPPPSWVAESGELDPPFCLVAAAEYMPRLRALCEAESPEPLRRRGLLAPPSFLSEA